MFSKLRKLDTKMEIGEKYKITAKNRGGGRKNPRSSFMATLVDEMEQFYIFDHENGYRECILKVDFVTGEYRVEGA